MSNRQPIQPLYEDKHGVIRFKANAIVEYLLEHGNIDLNQIAMLPNITREDRQQFAQLHGYSHSGFGNLSYATDEVYAAAQTMYEEGKSELEARLEYLEGLVSMLKEKLQEPIAALYEIHPDDLDAL